MTTLFDRRHDLDKFGGHESFLQPFQAVVQHWKGDQPDWERLAAQICEQLKMSPPELRPFDVFDIRRLLHRIEQKGIVELEGTGQVRLENEWVSNGRGWRVRFQGKEETFPMKKGFFFYAVILKQQNKQKALNAIELYAMLDGIDPQALPTLTTQQSLMNRKEIQDVESHRSRLKTKLEITSDLDECSHIKEQLEHLDRLLDRAKASRNSMTKSVENSFHDKLRQNLSRARKDFDGTKLTELSSHLLQFVHIHVGNIRYEPPAGFDWKIEIP
jgi:hypothetical protein